MVLEDIDSAGDKLCSYDWVEQMLKNQTDALVKDVLDITCEGDFVKAYRQMLNVLNITDIKDQVGYFIENCQITFSVTLLSWSWQ